MGVGGTGGGGDGGGLSLLHIGLARRHPLLLLLRPLARGVVGGEHALVVEPAVRQEAPHAVD